MKEHVREDSLCEVALLQPFPFFSVYFAALA